MKYYLVAIGAGLLLATIISCAGNSTKEGKVLAQTYCGNCHQVPDPKLLNKESWEKYMLPRMGVFLGIIEHDSLRNVLVANDAERAIATQSGVFPNDPVLSREEWQKIKDYFISNAPEEPIAPEKRPIEKGLTRFEVLIPDYKLSPPSITHVKFNPDKTIYLGDANTQSLSVLSNELKLLQAAKVKEGAVWTEEFPDELLVTVMGSFSPTDLGSGFILSLPKTPQGKPYKLVDSLRRPVHTSYGDINGDGRQDIVVCEFAKWTGQLSWRENMGNGTFTTHVLRARPGALKAYIKDMNGDKKPDIVALFGQGDEGVFIYYNEGGGRFREEQALQFSPSNGSTYFALFDFNNDGHDDIIYTAGDNADFPPILKYYHGIYIFLNDGKNAFKQQSFFPLNGAYCAIPRDFDLDGDIDIAAISFFPDYKSRPEESFVYLENGGNFNFTARTIDQPSMGRWIVMDAADYDGDGDEDLILGSLAFEVPGDDQLVKQWVDKGIPCIILKNTTRK